MSLVCYESQVYYMVRSTLIFQFLFFLFIRRWQNGFPRYVCFYVCRNFMMQTVPTLTSVLFILQATVHSTAHTQPSSRNQGTLCILWLDKRETDRNLVIMEKECFIRTMDVLLQEIPVKEVVTDAHPQITALLSKENGCIILISDFVLVVVWL